MTIRLKFFIVALLLLGCNNVMAQQSDPASGIIKVRKPYHQNFYLDIDKPPVYADGNLEHTITNLLRYPKAEEKNKTGGIVLVWCIADKDGSVIDASVKRSLSAAFDAEAIRVVKSLKKFTPYYIDGKAYAVRFVIPVKFVAP